MAEKRPSIFIGMPCYGTVAPDVLEDFSRFLFHCGRRLPQYDFHLGIRTKSEQFRARNAIVDAALQMNCDYLLMLDDDMIVNPLVTNGPTEDYGLIERLIGHDKDLVGALYFQRHGECAPVAMVKAGETGYRFLTPDELTGGLQRVDVAGGGCLLIKTKVFDHLAFPYFGPEYQFGTDIQLCRKAAEKGFETWLDSGVELGHVRDERVIVTSRNRQQFLADSLPGEMKKTFVTSELYGALERDAATYTGYRDLEEMSHHAQAFMQQRKVSGLPDREWYRQFPKERIARQVWFNTLNANKRQMTEYILAAIDSHKKIDVLDFGCGIGIPAFALAQKGHRVTACDVQGTGTLEFLTWRAKHAKLDLTIHESTTEIPPLGDKTFDVIIAMDCLEHLPHWQEVLASLAARLRPRGVLFANNAILDDQLHPEHYSVDNKAFVQACMASDLMPFNAITYTKRVLKDSAVIPQKELLYA